MNDLFIPQSTGMMWLDVIIAILLVIGAFFVFVAALGLVRFQDVLLRMHGATKAGALGTGMILVAIALFFHDPGVSTRALAGVLFVLATAPIAAHLIGRAAYIAEVPLHPRTAPDELRGHYDRLDTDEPSGPETPAAPTPS